MLFEGISKVMVMAVSNIFITEVVNDEDEEDTVPFLEPKARSGGALVVAMLG